MVLIETRTKASGRRAKTAGETETRGQRDDSWSCNETMDSDQGGGVKVSYEC